MPAVQCRALRSAVSTYRLHPLDRQRWQKVSSSEPADNRCKFGSGAWVLSFLNICGVHAPRQGARHIAIAEENIIVTARSVEIFDVVCV